MADWRFGRRQDICGACETAFEEGQRYVSALTISEDEIAREDACTSCWRERAAGDDPDELFFWYTRHRADKKKTLQLDLASLEHLFQKLEKRTEEAARELRFVLCLLLMRKRKLKLERVVRGDDGEAMLVRRPRRKDTSKVYVFDFTSERLDELKHELREVFDGAEGSDDDASDASSDEPSEDADGEPVSSGTRAAGA